MPIRTPLVVGRATAFADAVRRRALLAGPRRRGVARAGWGVPSAGLVLLTRPRPLVRHVHHRSAARLDLRLAVAVAPAGGPTRARGPVGTADRAAARPAPGTTAAPVWPRTARPVPAPTVLRGAPAAAVPSSGRPGLPGPTSPTVPPALRTVLATSAGGRVPGAPPAAARPPRPVPMVLAGGTTSAASGPVAPGPFALASSAPGTPRAPQALALTAADLPGVVDRVVHELDRRVVAARERRGWTS